MVYGTMHDDGDDDGNDKDGDDDDDESLSFGEGLVGVATNWARGFCDERKQTQNSQT